MVQRDQWNVMVLSDICGRLLVALPGEQHIGPLRREHQRGVHLRPALIAELPHLTPHRSNLPHLPEGVKEERPEIAIHVQPRLGVQPVGNRLQTGRLRKADQVGRHRHDDVVSPAL
ncbi:Uncharacterised protein [Mycobacteroides abscessus subsp. massiliense]|nr:Uncharacterised protein [Mycobacteroides abscessus subsp. massiliense]